MFELYPLINISTWGYIRHNHGSLPAVAEVDVEAAAVECCGGLCCLYGSYGGMPFAVVGWYIGGPAWK